MAKDWKIELIRAHTRLFRPPKGCFEGAQGYPECNDGWRDLLERACVKIENVLDRGVSKPQRQMRAAARALDELLSPTVRIDQIKEKYGTLRFYWSGHLPGEVRANVEEAVDLAEARSACTCEICGAEGRLYNRGGWLATACSEHAEGEPTPVRPGLENLYITRTFRGGRLQTLACRRYDRTTDAFVEIDPCSLEIKDW